MTTAFDPSPSSFSDAVPVRSGSMADRLADAAIPLIGGSAPSSRRGRASRRQTFVPRATDRILVYTATASLAAGGAALAVGVSMLF
jgi:hypothetical protein